MAKIHNFHKGRKDALATTTGGVIGKCTPVLNALGALLSVNITGVKGGLTPTIITEMQTDFTAFWNATQVNGQKWAG